MKKFPCPSCGAEVPFKSSISVYAVCSYCGAMLVRRDLDIENLGKQAQLPEDMSPFQIGTLGVFEGSTFELVGRMRIGWKEGFWNEWYALFNDGREGWLAEAQGFLMMSFRAPPPGVLPKRDRLSPGYSFAVEKLGLFEVDDMKDTECVGSQGELPLQAAAGRKSLSVDLSGPENRFAAIEYSAAGERFFVGRYVEFNDMKFTNLRELNDDW
jgi:predicted RNA-binding Zn-ribbon protein involved in translation (DUF1610 family)